MAAVGRMWLRRQGAESWWRYLPAVLLLFGPAVAVAGPPVAGPPRFPGEWRQEVVSVRPPARRPQGMQEWTLHKTIDGLHPDGREQQMLWLMNRARSDPAKEGEWLASVADPDVQAAIANVPVDTDLLRAEFATIPPAPPAAFDRRLYQAAYQHSQAMVACDCQTHSGQSQRVSDAGFDYALLRGNVFAYANSAIHAHAALNIDWVRPGQAGEGGMQPGRGHRVSIMAMDRDLPSVGIAVEANDGSYPHVGPLVVTGNYARAFESAYTGLPPDHFNCYVVGTVWDDTNGNGLYDPGEGRDDIRITPDRGSYYAITGAAGGYAIPCPDPGPLVLRFTGQGLPAGGVVSAMLLAGTSRLADLELSAAPTADLEVTPRRGPAPLAVTMAAHTRGVVTDIAWQFGDGGQGAGAVAEHTMLHPGRYTVVLTVAGPGGEDRRTAEVSVAHPGADVDGDRAITLADLVSILQLQVRQGEGIAAADGAPDIDGDHRTGSAEAVYILTWLAEE